MGPYGDTNFVTALYLATGFESEAQECLAAARVEETEPVCITDLTCLEVGNAMPFHVFNSRHGGPLRISPEAAIASFGEFEEDLETGEVYKLSSIGWTELRAVTLQLSLRHTARHGFRCYDLIHVASALILKRDRFWSFDRQARNLARLEGLAVNPSTSLT
jgi:predicted nucleic acid-binding protein